MDKIVQLQRDYFNSNATKAISFRIEQLRRLEKVIKTNEQLMYDAIYRDFKKSEFDAYTSEISFVLNDIREAIQSLKKWSRRRYVRTNLANFPASSYIIPEPLGVSLVIGAWNYPYQLSLAPVVAAIAAGCTVILKPSELSAETSAVMAQLINTNFDPNYLHVIEGGIPETTALLEQKFDKIFFTGSVPVGKIVYQAAAKQLTPVTLELGGKSPAFVTESCHLKMTAKRLIWAKFFNAGQTCIAPDYVLVDERIEHAFIQACIAEIEESHFSFENDNYVQIINERNFDRLMGLIPSEKVVHGGNSDRHNRFIEPTLLSGISWEDAIMQDEIFGPILPILSYNHLDDAIREVKNRPRPLSCYVFTKTTSMREKILAEISFGGGAVNDALMHISNPHFPFGGVGESGIGAYHGEEGFRAFSHYKSILDKPTWFELGLKYSPRSPKKLKWVKWIMNTFN